MDSFVSLVLNGNASQRQSLNEGVRGALRLRKIILWTTDSTRAGDQRDMTIAVSRV